MEDFLVLQSSKSEYLLCCMVDKSLEEDPESDLSKPDPLALQVDCQKRVQGMGINLGSLWM
jgi:hypothetical protein